ncbi:MAG TPA: phosphotransferase, partial [Bacillota bacterium]|nr:phosphotransferase [Bacillota bacterium]
KLAVDFRPGNYRRPDYNDQFKWMEEILQGFPGETGAMSEIRILRDFFTGLPRTKENFGLIHYDFELDNVFWDETNNCFSVIDFDDAQYHWFVMDLEQAVESLCEEGTADNQAQAKGNFIEGYRSEFGISDEMVELMPVFRRYANLYGYVRILRSGAETWKNEPEWMVGLREKLTGFMKRRGELFGVKIE